MPNLKKEEIKPYQATIKECEKCGYQKSPSTQFEDMPNPEQNKWEEEFDKKWTEVQCSAHERTSSALCICNELEDINSDYGYKEIKIFIRSLLSQTRQETIEQIEKTIKARLKYCQEHNGLPYCKNCGLELLDIERLK